MPRVEIFIFVVIAAAIFCFGLFLQELSNRGVFFGVRIPLGLDKEEKLLKYKRKYKRNFSIGCFIHYSILILLMLNFREYFSLIIVLGMFSLIVIMNLNYYIIHREVKALKAEERWVLPNKRIVVVDMKLREKDEKNRRVVISPLWFFVPLGLTAVNILIMFGYLYRFLHKLPPLINPFKSIVYDEGVNFQSFIGMILPQVVLTLILYGCYKIVERAKQLLNGGEVNEIRKQNRAFRYVSSALFVFFAVIFNLSITITNLSNMTMLKLGERNTLMMIIAITIIPFIACVLVFGILGQSGKNLGYHGEVHGDKLVINRDDDDNYIMGSMYYNKYDPSLIVEKRVGVGWDLNFARPAAKIFIAVIAALILGVIIMTIKLPGLTREREILVTENAISISGMWGITVNSEDIEKVNMEDMLPEVSMETKGAGLGDKMFGYWTMKNYGKSSLFILDKNQPVIVIYMNN